MRFHRMQCLPFCLALCTTLLGLGISTSQAQTADMEPPLTAEEVRQTLRQPLSVDFAEAPLQDAIQHLADQLQLSVRFDKPGLEEEGINLEDIHGVTCKLENVVASAALDRILATHDGLDYYCTGTGLVITSVNRGTTHLFPRLYDITDLFADAKKPADEPGKVEATKTQFGGGMGGLGGGLSGAGTGGFPTQGGFFGGTFFGNAAGKEDTAQTALIDMLLSCTGGVDNGSPWYSIDGEGGDLRILKTPHAVLLVVRQSEKVHRQIEELLNEMILMDHQRLENPDGEESAKTARRTKGPAPRRIRIVSR